MKTTPTTTLPAEWHLARGGQLLAQDLGLLQGVHALEKAKPSDSAGEQPSDRLREPLDCLGQPSDRLREPPDRLRDLLAATKVTAVESRESVKVF